MTHNFPNDSPPLQINVCDPSEIKADTKGTSAKFKNTLQLRTGSYYFRGYIPLILASVVRSCIPKRQDHAEGQARQDAVEILLSLGKEFTDSIGRKFNNSYYEESFILNIAYVALYILNQKNVAKTKYIPLLLSLFPKWIFQSC